MARAILKKLKENSREQEKVYIKIFDERVHKMFENYYDVIPNFKEIHDFLLELFKARDIKAECGVMAVVYIDRFFCETGVTFDKTNWRPLVFTAVLLATKVWEDYSVWNVDYVDIFPGLEVESINNLEREFLHRICFNLVLSQSIYARYYFELRSLASVSDESFPIKPLDKSVATVLEMRSTGAQQRAKLFHIHSYGCFSEGEISATLDDL